jgi:type II secretory pathway pseudopilin PulG
MAALLVSIGVMSILLSAAMPVWRHEAQREREAELVFRGEQYARAVGLFQRKYAGAFPPNLDVLLDQRFLRKKYADPMTEDGEFQLLYLTGQAGQPGAPQGGGPRAEGRGGAQAFTPRANQTASGAGMGGIGGGAGQTAGITGVVSKSKAESVRVYNGRSHYNEWEFLYSVVSQQPGAGAQAPTPGQPGQAPRAPAGPGPFELGPVDRPGSDSVVPPPFPPGEPPPRNAPRIRF